ncbi:DsbA family oxidoreductase, partial [Deinococcus yavapaiensis]
RVDSRDITSTSIVDQPHETGKSRPARFSDALYIGLKRIDDLTRDEALDVRWIPFQLRPDMPEEGAEWKPYATEKFGGEQNMRRAFEHVEQYACDDDLCFRFDVVASAPNTVDAHRVILLAGERGVQTSVALSVMKGYFEEGADLRDPATLVALAERGGLTPDDTRALLASERFRADVDEAQRAAAQAGVQGVPFYVLAEQYAVNGAQPKSAMLQALRWVREQRAAFTP